MSEAPASAKPRLKEQLDTICVEMISRRIHFREALAQFEKSFILEILEHSEGNLTRASRTLGIHRNTLAKKMAQFKIKKRK